MIILDIKIMDVRRKNQEISRMGFTSQLFKFETKRIVVLQNILQIKLLKYVHVICYIDLNSYKYHYIKKVCFDDRKHVLLHCQFTSLYAKE